MSKYSVKRFLSGLKWSSQTPLVGSDAELGAQTPAKFGRRTSTILAQLVHALKVRMGFCSPFGSITLYRSGSQAYRQHRAAGVVQPMLCPVKDVDLAIGTLMSSRRRRRRPGRTTPPGAARVTVEEGVELARFTTLGTGGPARAFARPDSVGRGRRAPALGRRARSFASRRSGSGRTSSPPTRASTRSC